MELLNEFFKDTSKIKDTFNRNFHNELYELFKYILKIKDIIKQNFPDGLSENELIEIPKLINFILVVRRLKLNIEYYDKRSAFLLIKDKQSELFNITDHLSKTFKDITDNDKQLLNNDNNVPKLEPDNDKNNEK